MTNAEASVLTAGLSPQQRCRAADPFGDPVHLCLALIACLLVASNTAPTEFAFAALLLFYLLRLPKIATSVGPMIYRPLLWLIVAYIGYAALSVLWSADKSQGLEELLRIRFLVLAILIYPVVDRFRLLVAAILCGVVLLHVAQALQLLDLFPQLVDNSRHVRSRIGGLNHPGVSANLTVCAAALHLSGLLAGRGRLRAISALGLAAAMIGLLLTGSRGPWLAALALLPLQLIVTGLRQRALRKPVLLASSVILAALLVVSLAFYSSIRGRIDMAVEEITRVVESDDYASHTGARLLMGRLAWTMFMERPISGYGGGSYHVVAADREDALLGESVDPGHDLVHRHAHNLYLHEAATRGIIGIVIATGLFVGAIVTATGAARGSSDPWRHGLGWAILGLAFCAMFDHLLITHTNAYMLGLLFGLSLAPADPDVPEIAANE